MRTIRRHYRLNGFKREYFSDSQIDAATASRYDSLYRFEAAFNLRRFHEGDMIENLFLHDIARLADAVCAIDTTTNMAVGWRERHIYRWRRSDARPRPVSARLWASK